MYCSIVPCSYTNSHTKWTLSQDNVCAMDCRSRTNRHLQFHLNYSTTNGVHSSCFVFVYHSVELSHAGSASPRCLDVLPSSTRGRLGWRSTIHISLNSVSLFYTFGVCVCVSVCMHVYVYPSVCIILANVMYLNEPYTARPMQMRIQTVFPSTPTTEG